MLPARSRATFFLVLIFLCGLLSGAVGANLYRRVAVSADSVSLPSALRAPDTPKTKRAVQWFTRHLHLSSEQVQQLSDILEETRDAYHLHELEIESIRQQSNTRIREILTDEQRAQFDAIRADARRRRDRDRNDNRR